MDDQKLTIPKNVTTLVLYIRNIGDNKLVLNKPTYTANEGDLTLLLSGDLANGGRVTAAPLNLIITIACQPYKKSKTDIAIELNFVNSTFSLFFAKECDTVQEIEEYVSILYVIYWILIFLIFAFIFVVLYFYLKNNDITLYDLIEKTREKLFRKCASLRNGGTNEEPYYDTNLQEYPKKKDYGGL
jgi:hypothetical protein